MAYEAPEYSCYERSRQHAIRSIQIGVFSEIRRGRYPVFDVLESAPDFAGSLDGCRKLLVKLGGVPVDLGILPFTPVGGWFGFETPPLTMLVGTGIIVIVYLVAAEFLKPLAVARTSGAGYRSK